MLIRLIIYGFLIYLGYYIFRTFKTLRRAAEQAINKNDSQQKKSTLNKQDAEELDYEEVEERDN